MAVPRPFLVGVVNRCSLQMAIVQPEPQETMLLLNPIYSTQLLPTPRGFSRVLKSQEKYCTHDLRVQCPLSSYTQPLQLLANIPSHFVPRCCLFPNLLQSISYPTSHALSLRLRKEWIPLQSNGKSLNPIFLVSLTLFSGPHRRLDIMTPLSRSHS